MNDNDGHHVVYCTALWSYIQSCYTSYWEGCHCRRWC